MPAAARRDPLLAGLAELRRFGIEFHDSIQHHIAEEENDLLRVADQQLTAEDQQRLYERMRALAAQSC